MTISVQVQEVFCMDDNYSRPELDQTGQWFIVQVVNPDFAWPMEVARYRTADPAEKMAEHWRKLLGLEQSEQDAKDAARLDFISREWFYINDSGEIAFRFNEAWHADRYPSLRAAIDAAMKEAQR